MNLFELAAVIKLDSSKYEQGVKKAEKNGASFAKSLKNGLATAAKVAGAAMGVAAAGVAALTKSAVDGFAEYEQLAGGAAKIFDEMSQTDILRDAQNAYKDLGLSANQYLAVINDVGATFAATMGDAAGYEAAKTGLKAISDYASGTGKNVNELSQKFTLITRSTSSYQSIADQFSGILPATSAGFLEQAQAAGVLSDKYKQLTEVPIEEYQAAVSQMLEKGVADLGLANNTMEEAFSTLSGSLAMAKGAWSNLVTGLADDSSDFDTLMSNFVDSVVAVGENIIPRIETTIQGITQLVSAASKTIVPLVVDALIENLPSMMSAGVDLVLALVDGILDNENLPKVIESGVQLIVALAVGLIKAIPKLLAAVPIIIGAVVTGIGKSFAPVVQAGRDFVERVKDGFMEKVKAAKEWGKDLMSNFIDGLLAKWNKLKNTVSNIAGSIADFLGFSEPEKGPLSNFHTYAPDMMDLFAQGIRENERVVTDQIQKSFDFRNSIVDGMDFAGSYTPSIAKAKASTTSVQATQSNTDTLLTAILNKLDGMGVYLDGTTLTGYIDSSLGRKTEQNKRLALA